MLVPLFHVQCQFQGNDCTFAYLGHPHWKAETKECDTKSAKEEINHATETGKSRHRSSSSELSEIVSLQYSLSICM